MKKDFVTYKILRYTKKGFFRRKIPFYIKVAFLYKKAVFKFNKLPNINKRCSKYAVGGYDLCCLHNKIEKTKDWHLRVTEYPDQIRTIHEYQLRDYFVGRLTT